MTIVTSEQSTLTLERTFNAPRERVFAAWASAEALEQWFGPGSCAVEKAEVDFRAGGEYRLLMTTESFGEVTVGGRYEEVNEPERIVFTWAWQGAEPLEFGETTVTIEFFDRGESTDLRLTHRGFPAAEPRESHEEGWTGCFESLAAHLG